MMQLHVNHLRTISSIEVMIRMFENLDPPKLIASKCMKMCALIAETHPFLHFEMGPLKSSLLPSIRLVTLRKDFVKTAALLLRSTHRFRGQHGGMGYAPFHPV